MKRVGQQKCMILWCSSNVVSSFLGFFWPQEAFLGYWFFCMLNKLVSAHYDERIGSVTPKEIYNMKVPSTSVDALVSYWPDSFVIICTYKLIPTSKKTIRWRMPPAVRKIPLRKLKTRLYVASSLITTGSCYSHCVCAGWSLLRLMGNSNVAM